MFVFGQKRKEIKKDTANTFKSLLQFIVCN